MKTRKIIMSISILVLGIFLVTGCSVKKEIVIGKDKKIQEKKKLKAKCSAVECIKKLNIDVTVEEANKIIGVDGKLTDEKYNFYEYDLGNDEKIILKYYSGDKATIEADFNQDDIANKKVDLSHVNDLKTKVQNGVTYDEFKAEIGNTDGILIEKSQFSNKYLWVSTKGGYIKATFSLSNNKCTIFTGIGDLK